VLLVVVAAHKQQVQPRIRVVAVELDQMGTQILLVVAAVLVTRQHQVQVAQFQRICFLVLAVLL
jgi:hypothetical protein